MARPEDGSTFPPPRSSKPNGIEDDPDHKSIYEQVSYPRYRLSKGVDPAAIRFAPTTYVDIARSSYCNLQGRHRQRAIFLPTCAFRQCMPTPHAALSMAMTVEDTLKLLPHFSQHVFNEVTLICEEIPHEDLAFQWMSRSR